MVHIISNRKLYKNGKIDLSVIALDFGLFMKNMSDKISQINQQMKQVIFNKDAIWFDLVFEKNKLINFENVRATHFDFNEQINNKDNLVIPLYVDVVNGKHQILFEDQEDFESGYAGFIGYLYKSKDEIRKKYNVKRITQNLILQIQEEVKSNFLNNIRV